MCKSKQSDLRAKGRAVSNLKIVLKKKGILKNYNDVHTFKSYFNMGYKKGLERKYKDIFNLIKENNTLKEYIIKLQQKLSPELLQDKKMLVNLELAISKTVEK